MRTRVGGSLGLSTSSSFVSLSGMVALRDDETTPLVNHPESDIEAETTDLSETTNTLPSSSKRNSKFARRVRYYVPSTAWIPDYSLSYLGGDLLAGMSIAAMLIPLSVSYGTSLAKLTPTAGLFAASIPPLMYSLLGGSRQLNVAPEAALSLLVGQAVTEYRHNNPNEDPDHIGVSVATAIGLQVGLFASFLGFFRLGFLDVVLSRALLRGFVTAIALVIAVEQLVPMFGLTALENTLQPESTLDKIIFLMEYIWSDAHKLTTIVSFGMLAALIFFRAFKNYFKNTWWIYRLPEVLIAVVLATVLSKQLRWDEEGVAILGDVSVQTGSYFFKFPLRKSTHPFIRGTTSIAILITILGYLDSIVAAKQSGDRYGYPISPNRELVALGAANLFGSFVPGTLPAFGSIVRTRINGEIGARSQLSSLFAAASRSPCDCLYGMIALSSIGAWTDLAMMFITFFLSVIWNIEIGLVVSLIISLLLVIRRSSKTRMTILGRIPGTDQWRPVTDNPEAEDVPGALIVRIRESLDFGARVHTLCLSNSLLTPSLPQANTSQLKVRLRRFELYGVEPAHPSDEPRRQAPRVLVFHMADVETCDASAVQIFHELLENYKSRGIRLFVTHLRPNIREMFENAGVVAMLGADAFYDTLGEAMAKVEGR
ncbi:sulfate transporter family-domain-containing protein [Pisolithus orientalis]|uniref:sulfate transporter family-domain-containing protein n=1 Tax=Pisolithus orientalis TaxID=936130 RepID=UPI0022251E07|nr:sulfate transporter family-domain-containing protein [Pisolithus orientalis]KAI6007619.1 sulfate transporter family-domain-containing protein [Pisolithus orientalis]